jgi:hypothetical protein
MIDWGICMTASGLPLLSAQLTINSVATGVRSQGLYKCVGNQCVSLTTGDVISIIVSNQVDTNDITATGLWISLAYHDLYAGMYKTDIATPNTINVAYAGTNYAMTAWTPTTDLLYGYTNSTTGLNSITVSQNGYYLVKWTISAVTPSLKVLYATCNIVGTGSGLTLPGSTNTGGSQIAYIASGGVCYLYMIVNGANSEDIDITGISLTIRRIA